MKCIYQLTKKKHIDRHCYEAEKVKLKVVSFWFLLIKGFSSYFLPYGRLQGYL